MVMIVLNNEKEIVEVESWEQITERHGFRQDIDPRQHELASIIGQYEFTDRVHCGLSNCRTPHNRGYLVVTKSGHETNIGNDCGHNYFGVEFTEMASRFDTDVRNKRSRAQLWSFKDRIPQVWDRINSIRGGAEGADALYKAVNVWMEWKKGQVPSVLVREVTSMVRERRTRIIFQRIASEQEVQSIEATTGKDLGRPHYINEYSDEIQGIEAFYQDNNLKTILIDDLSEKLKELEQFRIDAAQPRDLLTWARWVSEVDANLDRAEALLPKYRKFLAPDNLNAFWPLVQGESIAEFTRYLETRPQFKG